MIWMTKQNEQNMSPQSHDNHAFTKILFVAMR